MTNFRKLFKPEDFTQTIEYTQGSNSKRYITKEQAAETAQHILNEALDKATVVYCHKPDEETTYLWSSRQGDEDTHKALLINVEPIKECSHENYKPKFYIDQTFSGLECVDCGKKIIPTGFKVKE